jgi:lipoprotein NlpI
MRAVLHAMIACAALAFAAPALAQSQHEKDLEDCNQTRDPDRQIDGCTNILNDLNNRPSDRGLRALVYYKRGIAWKAKGDLHRAIADHHQAFELYPKFATAEEVLERAIADDTEAIRLDPKDATAYHYRGDAWKAKGDPDRAIADYDQAIRLDPKDASVFFNRGIAWIRKGDFDRAIADYDQAIRLDPNNPDSYFSRGRANLLSGALPKALADLNRASEMSPTYAYPALWLDIANKRNNLPSRLAEAIKRINMYVWPAPVISLYLGQSTPEAVLAAAADPDADTKRGQVCEANFYTGELAIQQGKKEEAKRLFTLAASDCPQEFMEHDGAAAELKVLSTGP